MIVFWLLRLLIWPICKLALKCLGVSLEDVEFRLLDDVSEFFKVFAAATTAFWAAVDTLGETLAVKFQAFRLRATTLWAGSHT